MITPPPCCATGCFEGRCFWCALRCMQKIITFAYLNHVAPKPKDQFDTWSGA